MSTPLELFGQRATKVDNFLEIAARLRFQENAERYLLLYLIEKLDLTPEDDLLEIGCGAGNLLIPFSFFVRSATGNDHKNLLAKMLQRIPLDAKNIARVPGDFRAIKISKKFSCVLIYSVLHYLQNEKEVLAFVRKAANLVKPGGRIFIGDIPNADLKQWFLSTKKGKRFSNEWQKSAHAEQNTKQPAFRPTTPLVAIDDVLIQKIVKELRLHGIRASVLPQPKELAFSFTRVDIIGRKKK